MKTKQVLSLLIITLCGCSASEASSGISITSQQISSSISHSVEVVTDTSMTITSLTQEDDNPNPNSNSSAESNPVPGNKVEQRYYRDDFNVLQHRMPENTSATYFDCCELDDSNIILLIKYRKKESSQDYALVTRYNRASKEETIIYNDELEVEFPDLTPGTGNSFALFDSRGYMVFEDDRYKQYISFGKSFDEMCLYLSSDFTKMICCPPDGEYRLRDTKTLEELFLFGKGNYIFPIFEKNRYIYRDWDNNLTVFDLNTGEKQKCFFDGHISDIKYYGETGILYFLDADQGDQSNTMTVYALNPETMKVWTHLQTTPRDGDVTYFDYNQKQYSYAQKTETGYRIKTVGIYNEYSLVTERTFNFISRIHYCGSNLVILQSYNDKMILIYI